MNELEQRIHKEIAEKGGIPFSRFMELALYEPGLGYYETQKEVGRGGDFFTSVSVGRVYGELLAFQIADWLEGIDGRVQLVEAGAHDGRLAKDVLGFLREWRPEVFARCELVLYEPSEIHRRWQQQTLVDFVEKVQWVDLLKPFKGVSYCNELLDACPAERLVFHKGNWVRSYVVSQRESFKWSLNYEATSWGAQFDSVEEGVVVASGDYSVWQHICKSLIAGRAMVVDYGITEAEFLDLPRANGTLRGYRQHQRVDDVLEAPGEIDITASVNFTEVERIAEASGLQHQSLTRQAQFLVRIFEQTLQRPWQFPEWTADRSRQFQTLVHPEHLGHAFKILECWNP